MGDLKDLKPGDEVAIVSYRGTPEIATITRVTPTQIHARGLRWNRKTGFRIGERSSFDRLRIELATAEHRHAAERQRLWTAISSEFMPPRAYETRRDLSTEAMRAIARALEADEARRGERG